jgi:hypothetical protein
MVPLQFKYLIIRKKKNWPSVLFDSIREEQFNLLINSIRHIQYKYSANITVTIIILSSIQHTRIFICCMNNRKKKNLMTYVDVYKLSYLDWIIHRIYFLCSISFFFSCSYTNICNMNKNTSSCQYLSNEYDGIKI